MNNFIAIVGVSLSLLAGCASPPVTPDWVSGTAAKHPAAQYLIGRGQATNSEEARDRARADLAKIFEVSIVVESEDLQAFHSAAGTPPEHGQYQSRSERRITARTDRVVEGIEIAETWQDPGTKNHHALAVLPRLKAATALRQEIERLDTATRMQLDRARDAQDLLLKVAAAAQAVVAQRERAALQKTLRMVDPAGRGDEPSWSLERLRADLDALLKRIKIVPRVTTESHAGLDPVVKGALAAAGFLADTGDKSDYTLEASLMLEDLGRREGWYWQRGTLEVKLIETAGNRVRGSQRWPIKSSALTRDGAVQRALSEVDTVLKKELRSTLIGFAVGASAN